MANLQTPGRGGRDPAGEQAVQLLDAWVTGTELPVTLRRVARAPAFKWLGGLAPGMWEARTHDVRMFGWFPGAATWVVGAIDLKVALVARRTGRPNGVQRRVRLAARVRRMAGLEREVWKGGQDEFDDVT